MLLDSVGMTGYDAAEGLQPFRAAGGYGAILFDITRVKQASPEWFEPAYWAEAASRVEQGGRGGAWFVEAPFGPAVLRRYLRGGMAAHLSRDTYWWQGAHRTRSFAEFRVARAAAAKGVPVAPPIAACYWRAGLRYRAAILIERLQGVHSLAQRALEAAQAAPWDEAGRLIARMHRAGLDHADLNAYNLLFAESGRGWVIDLDRGRLRIPETAWRERNLSRLQRSLRKVARGRPDERPAFMEGSERLRAAYDRAWERGY